MITLAPRDLRLARRAPFTALPMRKIPGTSVPAGWRPRFRGSRRKGGSEKRVSL